MPPEIEARYLGLEWLERGRARRVEVSPDPLDVELGLDGVLRVETQIFHDIHPWLGLRLSGGLSGCVPVFVDSQGQERPMLRVDDGIDGVWWVQDDGWDAAQQRHLSELQRTMGRFEVRIDDQRLLIENIATGLGQAQLDEYLQDFKRDLVWLVLTSGTATTSNAGTFFGDELPAALSDFASAAARVGSHPARVLREISAETRRSRLRPNAASFRQHARQPASPRLVGRASEETADAADNRYLRHMVQACYRLALTADQAAKQQATRFADRARFEDERSVHYGATSTRQVDPEIFARQLAELSEKLDRLADWSNAASENEDADVKDYRMEISKRYGKLDNNEFFYRKPEGGGAYDEDAGIRYNVVRVPKELCGYIVAAQGLCKEYVLTGKPKIRIAQSSNGKPYRLVVFSDVMAVKPDRQANDAKQRTRERLERNGWQYELSRTELQEMRRESRTAASRAETYRKVAKGAAATASALAACQSALRQQDAHWQALGVLAQSTFPMGMRYALSPDYAAVLKAFARVRVLAARAGVGDESLDDLNRIGILHASAVYERWCLVKIIGVLIEDFKFAPTPGWQDLVIRAVTGRPDSVNLEFNRKDVGVSATLEIQPLLKNGRRPDFRLHFKVAPDDVGAIVMDAKFRTRWRRGELVDMLTTLVEGKGYGGEKDRVFILQPQANTVLEPTSPLVWGQHCDYGQVWPANHRTGSIQLSAGAEGGGAQHNLQRLIAMGLQAVFPAPLRIQEDQWTSMSCCVRCGTRHEPNDVRHRTTRIGRDYWLLGCSHCGMVSIRTHCYYCDEALFKNGTDLTYHRTLADQIMNVMCPSCGKYFDGDFYDG